MAVGWRAPVAQIIDPSRPDWRRSLVLMTIAALSGAGVAVAGIWSDARKISHEVPLEDVALVNGRPVLQSDFRAQIEAVYKRPMEQVRMPQRLAVLKDMIREELLVQRGLELNAAETDPDVRTALFTAVEQKAISEVVTAQPSEETLRAYYQAHPTTYSSLGTMTLSSLLVRKTGDSAADLKVAQRAADEIALGATVAAAIRRYHLTADERISGALYYVTAKLRLGETLFAVAESLDDDQAKAVAAPDGAHVVVMHKNVRPVLLPYDVVRGNVLSDYKQAGSARLKDAEIRFLTARATITYAPGYRP